MLQNNFIELLEESVKKYWDSPAFSNFGEKPLNYKEIAEKILLFHDVFRKSKIKRGDKIAVVGPNSVNWAITYLSTITYGAVIVPILCDFHAEDIQHIVNHSDARYLFVAKSIYDRIDEETMPGLEAVFSLEDFSLYYRKEKRLRKMVKEAEKKLKKEGVTKEDFSLPSGIENSDLAAILYTSGTTGFSKGVMLPNNSLLANVMFARNNITLEVGSRVLSFLPLAHSYPCSFDFLFPFTVGCHITFLGQMPSPKILLGAFAEVKPCLILFVPLILEKLYKKQIAPLLNKGAVKTMLRLPALSSLLKNKIRKKLEAAFGGNFRQIVIGGAALNCDVEKFLKNIGLRFTVGYGMTECGPLISFAHWDEHRAESVGKTIGCLESKIASSDPVREVGEILVRGENVMLGYYKNEEATREVLDEEGWLRTGDLGVFDQDGFIYIKGRSKNMILGPSGQNIYPEEIESKLNVMPFIQESLVMDEKGSLIAIVYPDWESVDALKVKDEEAEKWLEKKMEENRKAVNETLPNYCRLSRIQFHAEPFEKTPTQKIKRFLYQVKTPAA